MEHALENPYQLTFKAPEFRAAAATYGKQALTSTSTGYLPSTKWRRNTAHKIKDMTNSIQKINMNRPGLKTNFDLAYKKRMPI